MRLDLGGDPVHTRSHEAIISLRHDGRLDARGQLLDLRTRGFLPVGGSMQGMGIIHHMQLHWVVDPATGRVEEWTPGQPKVPFEATPETRGESCRDPMATVVALAGTRLGDGFASTLRERIGGPAGCSHVLTLALFMDAAVRATLANRDSPLPALPPDGHVATLGRRDLIFEGHERPDGRVALAMRCADLHWNDAPPTALAPDRFAAHHELAAEIVADLWPGSLVSIRGGERRRTAADFADVPWVDRGPLLAALDGLGLVRGAATEILQRLGTADGAAVWVDALLMLAPALVQCRAAHPDSWHEKVRATPNHPGLTAIPDSCYMWRRGGALERIRTELGAVKGGR